MLVRARIDLPDRPGSLGRVAWTLGVLGADIMQVTVLERESGRAVDDLTLALPGALPPARLVSGIETIPGVRVQAVWPTREVPGGFPLLGLITQLARYPDRGVVTLVDALPGAFSAHWAAVLRGPGPYPTVVHASAQAPDKIAVGAPETPRPAAVTLPDGTPAAVAPLNADTLLLVARRDDAPPFHRFEVDRLALLADAAATLVPLPTD